MTEVYWLEQTEADVPPDAVHDWLSGWEADRLRGIRFARRRADWLLGRWTAKRALTRCLDLPLHARSLASIEIRPAPCGAPEVFLKDRPAGVTISLSHRGGTAACAVCLPNVEVGCDLEIVEARSDAFLTDWFTAAEQALVTRAAVTDRCRLLNLLWSGKESALKATRQGLRSDTRSVTIRPVSEPQRDPCHGWSRLDACLHEGRIFHGWWSQTGSLLRTVIASPPPLPPILLTPG